MVYILFTTNKTNPVSWLIRKVTKEPVSHVAILKDGIVLHSTFKGVNLIPFDYFKKDNTIVMEMEAPETFIFSQAASVYWKSRYDFMALFYLGLRYLLPRKMTNKVNLWQSSGLFLCTEFVTKVLTGEEDSLITPFKLYLKLIKQRKG